MVMLTESKGIHILLHNIFFYCYCCHCCYYLSKLLIFVVFTFFLNRVSIFSSGCPGVCYLGQSDLKNLSDSFA